VFLVDFAAAAGLVQVLGAGRYFGLESSSPWS
jgi:hypothetical protein